MSMTIKADLGGLNRLMAKLGTRMQEAARPAAQAAAQVLYEEVKRNATRGKRRESGKLASAIYQAYSADNSGPGHAVYHVSWNARKARHGHLVEFGHLQRYEYYQDDAGKVRPKVRPEMQGKPRPKPGGRNRAALDAYYVTLPTPVHVPAAPFVRPAMAKFPQAMAAARAELLKRINQP